MESGRQTHIDSTMTEEERFELRGCADNIDDSKRKTHRYADFGRDRAGPALSSQSLPNEAIIKGIDNPSEEILNAIIFTTKL